MKLMKNKKYLQQKFSRKVLVSQTTANFTSRVSKSYIPFTCKFPMVMHFVSILYRCRKSKTNFYVFSYDKTSLKFCSSFRFFLAVFMEKFQKICYLKYVRRGITPYRISIMQHLKPSDIQARMDFALWADEQTQNFWNNVWFSDEDHFHLSSEVNKQNIRFGGSEKPDLYVEKPLHNEKVTAWAALSANGIIGPFFF